MSAGTCTSPHSSGRLPASGGLITGAEGHTWVRGNVLGSGSFGTVYKAFAMDSVRIFAVKEALLTQGGERMERSENLDAELRICSTLEHKNIVRYFGHSYTDSHLLIFLEYVPGGSLAAVVGDFGALSGEPLRRAACGILEGLNYLHTRESPVVHRDLKAANVLVDLDMTVKLADFGCSKCSADTTKSFKAVGSAPWMAPEVINFTEGFGRKADIWSYGCTVIEMTTAERPWGNGRFNNMICALHHIATTTETPPLPQDASEACCGLIELCVRRCPKDRPSAMELLHHPFFVGGADRDRESPTRCAEAE